MYFLNAFLSIGFGTRVDIVSLMHGKVNSVFLLLGTVPGLLME